MTIPTVLRVLALVTLLLASTTASAQPPTPPPTEADRLFEEGRALAKEKKFAEACEKFERSFALDATLRTQLNLADCHEALGHLLKAWRLFEDAAEKSALSDDHSRTKFARERADKLVARLSIIVVRPPQPIPPNLTVAIGGRSIPVSAEIHDRVEPGEIEVVVTVPDHPAYTTRVKAVAGATANVVIPRFAPITTSDPPDNRGRRRMMFVWGLAGTGGVSAIVATILTLKAKSNYNEVAGGSHCTKVSGGIVCDDIGDGQIADAQRLADIGTAFAIGAAIVVGVSAAVYFTRPRREPVRVAPTASPHGVGFVVAGSF